MSAAVDTSATPTPSAAPAPAPAAERTNPYEALKLQPDQSMADKGARLLAGVWAKVAQAGQWIGAQATTVLGAVKHAIEYVHGQFLHMHNNQSYINSHIQSVTSRAQNVPNLADTQKADIAAMQAVAFSSVRTVEMTDMQAAARSLLTKAESDKLQKLDPKLSAEDASTAAHANIEQLLSDGRDPIAELGPQNRGYLRLAGARRQEASSHNVAGKLSAIVDSESMASSLAVAITAKNDGREAPAAILAFRETVLGDIRDDLLRITPDPASFVSVDPSNVDQARSALEVLDGTDTVAIAAKIAEGTELVQGLEKVEERMNELLARLNPVLGTEAGNATQLQLDGAINAVLERFEEYGRNNNEKPNIADAQQVVRDAIELLNSIEPSLMVCERAHNATLLIENGVQGSTLGGHIAGSAAAHIDLEAKKVVESLAAVTGGDPEALNSQRAAIVTAYAGTSPTSGAVGTFTTLALDAVTEIGRVEKTLQTAKGINEAQLGKAFDVISGDVLKIQEAISVGNYSAVADLTAGLSAHVARKNSTIAQAKAGTAEDIAKEQKRLGLLDQNAREQALVDAALARMAARKAEIEALNGGAPQPAPQVDPVPAAVVASAPPRGVVLNVTPVENS